VQGRPTILPLCPTSPERGGRAPSVATMSGQIAAAIVEKIDSFEQAAEPSLRSTLLGWRLSREEVAVDTT
jgi:hypothetical protein